MSVVNNVLNLNPNQVLDVLNGDVNASAFGHSIAISSDGSILVVGSCSSDVGTYQNAGEVFTYNWNTVTNQWDQDGVSLELSNPSFNGKFGTSVALSSDGSVLAVGDEVERDGTVNGNYYNNRGRVYIYERNGSTWEQRGQDLEALDAGTYPSSAAYFGSSVALSGDGLTLIVGSRSMSLGSFNNDYAGGVETYERSSGSWNWNKIGGTLFAPDAAQGFQFGQSVAISDDGNTLVVGSDLRTTGYNTHEDSGRGGVYTYERIGNSWNQVGVVLSKILEIAQSPYDMFGKSVSLSSDASTLCVGSGWTTTLGSITFYDWDGSSAWVQRTIDLQDNISKGHSVALTSDAKVIVVGIISNGDYDGVVTYSAELSNDPTYSLSANLDSADEGSTVTLTLQTTNVAENDVVPFTINGSGIVLEDFVNLDSLGAGEFTVGADGSATFDLEIYSDSTTEGPETFTVVLDDHQSISVDIDINDTSTTPAVMQSPSHSTHSLNLQKDATSKTYYIGWYGECATASNFNLTTLSADDIDNVFEINSENKVINYYTPGDTFSDFNTLELGKNYGIILKSQSTGGTSVSIPGFISTNSGTTGSLLLTDNCSQSPSNGANYEITLMSDYSQPNVNEGWHKEFYLKTKDGSNLSNANYGFKIEGVGGSNITSSDFKGWALPGQLYGGEGDYTPFNAGLNNGYFSADGTSSFAYIELGHAEDSATEGPETYRISLIGYPDVYLDMDIIDTPQSPTSYSLHIVDDGYGSDMAEVGDGFPNQKVIELRGVGSPLNTVVPFTISGSGITPDDFIGLDSLGAGEFTLDSAGQGYNFGRVTLTTNADNLTEGTEVFTLYLDEDQSVSVDVTIYDDSQETFPGTLTLYPHSADSGDPAYSPSMYEPLVNNSTADFTYFLAEISNWSGGPQTLQWEIDQNVVSYTYGIVGADDVQYEPHNPEAYNYNQEYGITINTDGVSGTWPINNTDYSGLRIWVLADSISEGVVGNARELLRLKVTDENGNVSQVDVWVDERP